MILRVSFLGKPNSWLPFRSGTAGVTAGADAAEAAAASAAATGTTTAGGATDVSGHISSSSRGATFDSICGRLPFCCTVEAFSSFTRALSSAMSTGTCAARFASVSVEGSGRGFTTGSATGSAAGSAIRSTHISATGSAAGPASGSTADSSAGFAARAATGSAAGFARTASSFEDATFFVVC